MELNYRICDICGRKYDFIDQFMSGLGYDTYDTEFDICWLCFEKYILPLKKVKNETNN